jgi:hypothetical protein
MVLLIGIQIYFKMLLWVQNQLKMNLIELYLELETTALGQETGIQIELLLQEMNEQDNHRLHPLE